ncbi:hypothetical protein THAOC_33706 [Thalassiosira oceanica]|uniref:Uncharacterized protein n=1 Tax=Thalassiosira oceanica TaxID=159749 RepID=K0RLH5_THAOC|nr:hypothetical protein THAOC_33706 [Thalassiosira oceanica]|eukprot:EJK47567.1 hypothetical protein THAOC_33706 [Thalassiosira oceanica]
MPAPAPRRRRRLASLVDVDLVLFDSYGIVRSISRRERAGGYGMDRPLQWVSDQSGRPTSSFSQYAACSQAGALGPI